MNRRSWLMACLLSLCVLAHAAAQVSKRDAARVYATVKTAVVRGQDLSAAVTVLRGKGLVDDSPQGLFNLSQAREFFAELRKLDRVLPGPAVVTAPIDGQRAGEQEPNDDPGSGTAIACGVTGDGAIDPTTDVDFWVFQVSDVSGVTIAVDTPDGSPLDPIVRLYDAAMDLLGDDDESGPQSDARLTSVVPAGTYFIEVLPAFAGSTGGYRLRLECHAALRTVGCRALVPIEFSEVGEVFGFELEVPERADHELRVHSFQSPVDPSLTLVDATGHVIARDDDGGPGTDARLQATVDAGHYYAIVDTFDGLGVGTAYFQSICNPAAGATLAESEPNDGIGNANTTRCCDVVAGEIASSNDVDAYRLEVLEATQLLLAASTAQSDLDSVIVLLDAHGDEIARDDDSGPATDALLEVPLDAGTYYVLVQGFQSLGSYQLALVCDALLLPSQSEVEPNDSRDLANAVDCGAVVAGAIGSVTDVDYFRLEVLTPMDVSIAVDTQDSSLDPRITIENGPGDRLFFDDDGGPDQDARLDVFLVARTYFLRVEGYASTGAYQLGVRCPMLHTGSLKAGDATTIWLRGRNQDRFFCLVGTSPGAIDTPYGVQLVDPAVFVLQTTIGPCGLLPSQLTIPPDVGGAEFLFQSLVGNKLWDGGQFTNRLAVRVTN